MYEVHKGAIKNRKNSDKKTIKRPVKRRKLEGILNMSDRLSIPPGFIPAGDIVPGSQGKSNCNISKEHSGVNNFNGLFDKCLNIRRSARLLKRNFNNYSNNNKARINTRSQQKIKNLGDNQSQTGHAPAPKKDFQEIFKRLKLNSYKVEPLLIDPQLLKPQLTCNFSCGADDQKSDNKHTLKRSKSIFDEINNLYSQTKFKKRKCAPNNFLEPQKSKSNFCNLLFDQIINNFTSSKKTLLNSKSRIFSEMNRVEDTLSGKMGAEPKLREKQRVFHREPEEEDVNWVYFDKSEWVYLTPPSHSKTMQQKIEEHHRNNNNNPLQPAVMYSTKKNTQIYEINPDSKINLSHFEGIKNVPISQNFLKRIGVFNHARDVDSGDPCASSSFVDLGSSRNVAPAPENTFNFSQPESTDFLNIFARPTKTVRKSVRTSGEMNRRKLEDALNRSLMCHRMNQDGDGTCMCCDGKNDAFLTTNEFKLEVPGLSSDQNGAGFSQSGGSDFCFMTRPGESALGFDFKNNSANCRNSLGFQ